MFPGTIYDTTPGVIGKASIVFGWAQALLLPRLCSFNALAHSRPRVSHLRHVLARALHYALRIRIRTLIFFNEVGLKEKVCKTRLQHQPLVLAKRDQIKSKALLAFSAYDDITRSSRVGLQRDVSQPSVGAVCRIGRLHICPNSLARK
ncbi:MAG TPA: hypothetical protein DDZ84_12435 [Firmicutes bacterium]|nr:hypothetical protein [Bacillota bacterium]